MAVKGIFTSSAGGFNALPRDVSTTILEARHGRGTPITALTAGMRNVDINSTVTTWEEKAARTNSSFITAIPDPLASSFTMEDTTWLTENTILEVPTTGEYLYVVGISGATVTVQRGFANTQIMPLNVAAANPVMVNMVSTAFEEASERPAAIASNPYGRSNIVMIMRTAWEISGTADAVKYARGDRAQELLEDAVLRLGDQIERAALFSRQTVGVINNKPLRVADGLLAQLRTNIFQASPGLTRRELTDFIEKTMSTNIVGLSDERLCFCSSTSFRALTEIAYRYQTGGWTLMDAPNEFGINVTKFKTNHGTISLIEHPLLNEMRPNDMYLLHPGTIEIRHLRRTEYVQENGLGGATALRDARGGVLTAEMTFLLKQESASGRLGGITVDHFVV